MKALIVRQDFDNYKRGDVLDIGKESLLILRLQPRPHILAMIDVPEGYDKEIYDLIVTDAQNSFWSKQGEDNQEFQPQIQYWEKDEEKVYEEPQDLEGWTQGSEPDDSWAFNEAVSESFDFVFNQAKLDARNTQQQEDAARAARMQKRELGKRSRELSESILDLIAGQNIMNNVSAEDISALQETFGMIEALLKGNRPFSARPLIQAIDPESNAFVTQELKDDIEAFYQESGLVEDPE